MMTPAAHRSMVKLYCTLLTAAIVGALAPTAALGSFPGGNGVIAYTAEGSIWSVDPSTGHQLRLTSGSAPAFSPSGNMLAFQRGAAGTVTVYLALADGSDARPLVQGSQPAFSSSGRQIVFVRAGGLFVTGLAPGSPVRQITNHPGDRAPQWSSRGSVVFERTDVWHHQGHLGLHVRSEIDVITPPRVRVRQLLTLSEGTDLWPDWSPDGKTVAVTLCKALPPDEAEIEPEPPRLHYIQDCNPSVWAPRGLGLADGCCSIARSQFFSCPAEPDEGSEISWQPVVAGTLPIPTVPCSVTPLREPRVKASLSEGERPRVHRTRRRSRRHH